MKPVVALAIGVGLGLVLAKLLINPSSCCDRVASGVRDKVGTKLGGSAQEVGDALGLWSYTPGLLDAFGVPK